MGEISEARVGIIGISNNYLYRDGLRERVKSTLCEDEIEFTPYTAGELETILNYYSELAFKNGVLADGVINKCAALTAQETGDARRALDLLETAGDVARRKDSMTVTETHVTTARNEVERAEIRSLFRNGLPVQQRLVLLAVTTLVIQNDDCVRANSVYPLYEKYAETLHFEPVTQRHFKDFLGSLVEKGLLTTDDHNLGRSGGRWFTYEPSTEPATIIQAVVESGSNLISVLPHEVLAVAESRPEGDKDRIINTQTSLGSYDK